VLLLALLVVLFWSAMRREVAPWNGSLAEFIAHLQAQGVPARVVSSRQDGLMHAVAYLTENPEETWDSFQSKRRLVECIGEWRGSDCVERVGSYVNVDDDVASWGKYGCRIGDFILFGDEDLLRRILVACQEPSGR
jgi:hypothetical protein